MTHGNTFLLFLVDHPVQIINKIPQELTVVDLCILLVPLFPLSPALPASPCQIAISLALCTVPPFPLLYSPTQSPLRAWDHISLMTFLIALYSHHHNHHIILHHSIQQPMYFMGLVCWDADAQMELNMWDLLGKLPVKDKGRGKQRKWGES